MSAEAALSQASMKLNKSLNEKGLWSNHWDDDTNRFSPHDLFDQLIATGHHLEWAAMVPDRLRPEDRVLKIASRSLVRELSEIDPAAIEYKRAPQFHGIRAVLMLSNTKLGDILDAE